MTRRLYRERDRRWVGGVCAGIAEYLGVPVFLVRLFMIPLLVTPIVPLTLFAYFIAILKIPLRPEREAPVDPDHEAFRRSMTDHPSATFGQVRHRMREIEHRIRRMEAYVTSPEFDFDQEFGGRR